MYDVLTQLKKSGKWEAFSLMILFVCLAVYFGTL